MIFEVANLLSKPVGTSDCITITRNHSSNKKYKNPVLTGTINMIRTDRGIWINATLNTSSFTQIASKPYENDENFKINTKLQLDLSDAITQYSLTSRPMKPIYDTTCLGICDQCGANKNITNCFCANSIIESKWNGLTEWQKEHISKNL